MDKFTTKKEKYILLVLEVDVYLPIAITLDENMSTRFKAICYDLEMKYAILKSLTIAEKLPKEKFAKVLNRIYHSAAGKRTFRLNTLSPNGHFA